MKTILPFLFFCLLANIKISGQALCSLPSSPNFIFYPNSTSTPTTNSGAQYLCGPNTIVYDTLPGLTCEYGYINTGATLFLKSQCGTSHQVWLKNGATLTILQGMLSPIVITMEPGAIINNLSGITLSTYTCSTITFPFVNCSAGIKENKNVSSQFNVYPNPTNNSIHISSEQNNFQNSEIEISDYLGQTVLKIFFTNIIDVSKLANGIYILKINAKDNQSYYSKFVKE